MTEAPTIAPTRWRLIRVHPVLSAAAALVLLIGVGWAGTWAYGALFPPALSCGSGMTMISKPLSCVGVNLDGHPMAKNEPPELQTLEKRINQQNGEVKGPYESVVLLLDLTPQSDVDTVTYQTLLPNIEGAITAQWEANHTAAYGAKPGVKLFLGNMGSKNGNWEKAVDQIKAHVDDRHIDEVVGLGQSTAETRSAAQHLTDGTKISVIGATVTADTMNFVPGTDTVMKHFFRLSPTNTNAASAAVTFLKSNYSGLSRVLVAKDTVSNDDYVHTLGADADTALDDAGLSHHDVEYSSPESTEVGQRRESTMVNVFGEREDQLCPGPDEAIFFTGRGSDLGPLVQSLVQKGCALEHSVIITGDDGAAAVTNKHVTSAADTGTRVYYTALASPRQWDSQECSTGVRANFERFLSAFTGKDDRCSGQPVDQVGQTVPRLGYPISDLENGQAMLTHDATAAAFQAARDGLGETGRPDTSNALSSYLCKRLLPGASGWIGFQGNNAVDAAVPVLRIDSSGAVLAQNDVVWSKRSKRSKEAVPLLERPVKGDTDLDC